MTQQPELTGKRPGNKSKLIVPAGLAALILCCACIGAAILLYNYGDALFEYLGIPIPDVGSEPGASDPAGNNPADTAPSTPIPDASSLPEWTIIVYSAADDGDLEASMWIDINEMELVGSSPQVNIVVQMDRYNGGFDADGNWSDTRRYLITQDDNLEAIASPVLENLGEVDMGDPRNLTDFATWAIQNYPAQKYALILSDHGGGWTGGYLDAYSQSGMSMPEIVSALEGVRQNTGIEKFEAIIFDACLMAQIEVFGAMHPYANFIVASEELVPGYGLSHAAWMGQLAQNPAMDGKGVSQAIVATYITEDIFLTEYARATANEIAQQEAEATMSAVESARIPDVIAAMNQFVSLMASMDQTTVAEARTYARHYASLFGEQASPSFIDLGNFSQTLASLNGEPALQQAAAQLQSAISSALVAEMHGSAMSGSTGIAFHFPDSDLYEFTEFSGNVSPTYVESASEFFEDSYWDEFLAFHYAGTPFAPQEGMTFVPSHPAELIAPGASELAIGPLQISDTNISGDETVTISTTVEGNVAYIYTALYFWDPNSNFYWIGDISYYVAENTITVDGVNSPDYGPSPVQVQAEWQPLLFIFTDGQHEAFALFEPLEYLSAEGNTVYGVYGQYTAASSATPVDALLSFDAYGNFLSAYAYPDPDGDGASNPVQITPQIGDHFTEYDQFITYDAEGNGAYEYFLSQDVFTWGEQGFSFHSSPPVDGEYLLVVMAYDFDNNFVWNSESITYQQ
ncbi:MAG: hypothetical protein IPG44_17540 [Anaerolineales bacterium]|jgi:hypothetical protein|nr:hypothetical protein [Chloroflexota bacterium]MBK6647518.1 hypothetical protein [Anaerolineales bacterium]MCC6985743.1 hypothetical protein [Anaerolineales bacterium]